MMTILGFAISLTVTDLSVVVQDLDQSPLSHKMIDAFSSSLTFRVESLGTAEQPDKALDEGQAHAALIIPEHFERDFERLRNVEIQMLIDATDANTAKIIRASAAEVTRSFVTTIRPDSDASAIKANIRLWYNPGRESSKYIAPAAMAVGLALFPSLLAALAMSREGEQKTLIQVYASGITAYEFLAGKVLAYCLIGGAEWALSLSVGSLLFGLTFAGDPTPLFAGTALYLFCNVSYGAMVGVAVPNQAAALQYVQLLGNLLSFLLSGYIFPVSQIPIGLRWLSNLVPARYYIEIIRDGLMRGGGWVAVWNPLLMMALLGSSFFLIAWWSIRKMQVKSR